MSKKPAITNTKKAFCKPNACARYPINGGPTNIPTILNVETMEIAIPGEYFLEVPAKAKVIGKIAAVPNPTKQNPNNAVQNAGNKTAINMPILIIIALNT